MQTVTLPNGLKMPILGYGVYQVTKQDCERCVLDALKVGYRHIDTAQAYQNEEEVGSAIVKSGIPRSEIFITTKVWITNYEYEQCKKSVEESLKKLQTNYIDLMLLHQPFGDYYGAWRALEEMYEQGKVKAIAEALNWLKKYNVQAEAWGPLAEGQERLFTNATLAAIGKKYNKSVAQVVLRWEIQRGIAVIPKSVHANRMKENFEVFDLQLTEEDMNTISSIDENKSVLFSYEEPSTTEMFMKYLVKYLPSDK